MTANREPDLGTAMRDANGAIDTLVEAVRQHDPGASGVTTKGKGWQMVVEFAGAASPPTD